MIPRKIHQVWLGDVMPFKLKEWCRKTQRINTGWEYRLWGDEILTRFQTDPIVAWMRESGQKTAFLVDRLRILLLHEDGGVYMDSDCLPCQPLNTLDLWEKAHVGFVAGMRPPDRQHVSLQPPGIAFVDNTVLASEPKGPIITRLVNLYSATSRLHTGSSIGREILRNADPRTTLLNWRYFYALDQQPESICLHDATNLASWCTTNAA